MTARKRLGAGDLDALAPVAGEGINPLFLPFECLEGSQIPPERLDLHARAIARMTRDKLSYLDAVALEENWPDPSLQDHGSYAMARGRPTKTVKAGG